MKLVSINVFYFNHKCLKLNPLQMILVHLLKKKSSEWKFLFYLYVLQNQLNCTDWKHNDIFLISSNFFFIYSCLWLNNHFSDCACNFGGDPSSHIDVTESCSSKNFSWALARLLCSISSRDLIKKTTFIRDLSYLISILMLFDTVMSF